MSPASMLRPTTSTSFPRVSGDEPVEETLDDIDEKFSPRERG